MLRAAISRVKLNSTKVDSISAVENGIECLSFILAVQVFTTDPVTTPISQAYQKNDEIRILDIPESSSPTRAERFKNDSKEVTDILELIESNFFCCVQFSTAPEK